MNKLNNKVIRVPDVKYSLTFPAANDLYDQENKYKRHSSSHSVLCCVFAMNYASDVFYFILVK